MDAKDLPRDFSKLTDESKEMIDLAQCKEDISLEAIRKSPGQVYMIATAISKTSTGKLKVGRTMDLADYGVFVFLFSYRVGCRVTDFDKQYTEERNDQDNKDDADEDDGDEDENEDEIEEEDDDCEDKPRIYVFMHLAYLGENNAPLEYLSEHILKR